MFSSTLREVDWNARLVTGDAVAEIARLKAGDGPPMRVGGAPYLPALDGPTRVDLVETRTFPGGVVLTRYVAA